MIKRIFNWLTGGRARRRAAILEQPFPDAWMPALRRAVPHDARLSPADRRRLRECVQIFVAEKQFLGCRGVDITDDVRVIVAAGACQLLLGLPHLDVFPRLREIIIYPHDLTAFIEAIGPDGTRYQIDRIRAGEAWRRGPVVLAWNNVARSLHAPADGYNVVLHEFAHVLDLQNGDADGVPPLPSRDMHERWMSVFFDEYKAFVSSERRGEMTFIDPYAATDAAEFFAVATEHFYEQPAEMQRNHPALFQLLVDFYGRDPTTWQPANPTRWFARRSGSSFHA